MYACSFVVLLAVGAFFALPHIPNFGALDVKIVKSGSMEPGINTGGVVVIREIPSYTIGDIVTFESATADIPTTHRIIGTEVGPDGATYFVTKGDANEDRDADLVSPASIIGKVVVDAPYVGFLLDFARQPVGFALLIGLPALLIIIDEVEKIWNALRARRRTEDDDSSSDDQSSFSSKGALPRAAHMPLVVPPLPSPRRVMMHDIIPRTVRTADIRKETFAFETYAKRSSRLATGAFSFLIMGVTMFSSTYFVGGTVSYARDIEASLANLFETTTADFTLDADTTNFGIIDGALVDTDVTFTITEAEESDPLQYRVFMEARGGEPALCEALLATSPDPLVYDGQMQSLGSPDVSDLPGITFDLPWSVNLALDAGTSFEPGTFCEIQVNVIGWLTERTEITSKFIDEEFLILTFAVETPVPFALDAESLSLEDLSMMLTEDVPTEDTSPEEETENSGGGSTPAEPEIGGEETTVEEQPLTEEIPSEETESNNDIVPEEEEEAVTEVPEEEPEPEPTPEPEPEVEEEAPTE